MNRKFSFVSLLLAIMKYCSTLLTIQNLIQQFKRIYKYVTNFIYNVKLIWYKTWSNLALGLLEFVISASKIPHMSTCTQIHYWSFLFHHSLQLTCYMHSLSNSDDDNGVLLTNTYTKHFLLSHIWATLLYQTTINCLVLSVTQCTYPVTHTHGTVTVVLIKDRCQMM